MRKCLGSASDSRHIKGCAIDFEVIGVKPQEYANLCYSFGLVRIGVYSNFVHADTDYSPIWLSKVVGNWKKIHLPYMNKLISKTKNQKDYQVAIIQWKLNKLGFECGKEDSIFGNKTEIAVKNYQSKHNLIPDGIVGEKTWNKLFNL